MLVFNERVRPTCKCFPMEYPWRKHSDLSWCKQVTLQMAGNESMRWESWLKHSITDTRQIRPVHSVSDNMKNASNAVNGWLQYSSALHWRHFQRWFLQWWMFLGSHARHFWCLFRQDRHTSRWTHIQTISGSGRGHNKFTYSLIVPSNWETKKKG